MKNKERQENGGSTKETRHQAKGKFFLEIDTYTYLSIMKLWWSSNDDTDVIGNFFGRNDHKIVAPSELILFRHASQG